MTIKQAVIDRALELGFARALVADVKTCETWRADTLARPDARWEKIASDPQEVLPDAKRVIVLARAYHPYRAREGEAALDAYYVASNASHQAAGTLAEWMRGQGMGAAARPLLPHKATCVGAGFARYGRNGLSYMDGLGSRYQLELVVTDEQLDADEGVRAERALSARCANCGACAKACPVGALMGNGLVDTGKCLRALAANDMMDARVRPLVGASLLGCDICQRVCPMNREIEHVAMPEDVRAATNLKALLAGEIAPLKPLIGSNYARKKQVQARACLIAGNLKREDCLPLIEALMDDEYEAVREHARWARRRLT